MNSVSTPVRGLLLGLLLILGAGQAAAEADRTIPPVLQPWETWATWNDLHRNCPTPYSDPKVHRCFWPGRLGLQVNETNAQFELTVSVFHPTWVPLPGSSEAWPQTVLANGVAVAVLEREGVPSVRLESGVTRLEGSFRWPQMPQNLRVPSTIGVLSLTLSGQAVETPAWDAQGLLWFRREGAAEAREKDFLAVKLAAALEDGIPLWWHQEIELTVSGRSREEDLGVLLPEGWRLASVEGPLPVAVDAAGRFKIQARAGKWTLRASAFRLDDPKELRFAATPPVVAEEWVAFRAKPEFRVLEILGSPSVDVSQIPFPAPWRELPVYRWNTATPFRIAERLRGMGDQKQAGLTLERSLWLDEDGRGLTFRDRISGSMQQVWRLDVAEGQELGSVRSGGQGQLVTRNPLNNAAGVELRSRNLQVEAMGRMKALERISATGWRSDAESVQMTLHLPPGWRLFALFGADWVQGDWLTAWTLLDLFLLLLFTLAVFRLRGLGAALLAFAAFGLSFHETGAPRYLWLVLLVPMALLGVLPEGRGRRLSQWALGLAAGGFLYVLVPFVARQAEFALYPQLEIPGGFEYAHLASESLSAPVAEIRLRAVGDAKTEMPQEMQARYARVSSASAPVGNLLYDSQARIQTGPGVPEWTWRAVHFGWKGPVAASQEVRPVLVSLVQTRILTVLRIGLLFGLVAVLFRGRRLLNGWKSPSPPVAAVAVLALLVLALPVHAAAEPPVPVSATIPDAPTLERLRERLLEVSDAYPNAASIPSVDLKIAERRLTLDIEVHVAVRTAVPLPGRLPSWSPVSVQVDGRPESALRRDDGYLWVVLVAGVHRVQVEGTLAGLGEWEWTYLLKPRRVRIEAPGWTQAGVRPDGVPEPQVFLAPERRTPSSAARYEEQEVQSVFQVDRHLEMGLQWQVRTEVTRLSPSGKAVSLRLPLLPGENVLTPGMVAREGFLEVRLGAQQTTAAWEGSLAIVPRIRFATQSTDAWVERWHLTASPVWNVALSGLPPVFEPGNRNLVPVWQPWPGETVELIVTRPEAIAGATVTISRASHAATVGQRQRVSTLDLTVQSSLGEDFPIDLAPSAEITRLVHAGKEIPVRRDGSRLVVPLRPGEQNLVVGWKETLPLGFRSGVGEVRLPAESANVLSSLDVGEDRWVLWAEGPRRGPAVRFWGILLTSLMAAFALGRVPKSPLRSLEWMLLVIGLTQAPLAGAFAVVGWFFFLRWRGQPSFQELRPLPYNAVQVLLVLHTVALVTILIVVVGEGLLGSPKMFISGNGSTRTHLAWFEPRSGPLMPLGRCVSVSIWWYRFLMLLWALWLAAGLLRWLGNGWKTFSGGGLVRRRPAPMPLVPPAIPSQ